MSGEGKRAIGWFAYRLRHGFLYPLGRCIDWADRWLLRLQWWADATAEPQDGVPF